MASPVPKLFNLGLENGRACVVNTSSSSVHGTKLAPWP